MRSKTITALALAITAPTEELAADCASMAFAVGLTSEQIEAAKAAAKQIAEIIKE